MIHDPSVVRYSTVPHTGTGHDNSTTCLVTRRIGAGRQRSDGRGVHWRGVAGNDDAGRVSGTAPVGRSAAAMQGVDDRRVGVAFALQVPLVSDGADGERKRDIIQSGRTPASATGFGSAAYGQGGAHRQ